MNLRPATPGDLDRIYQITEQSFGPYCAAQAIYERYGIGRGVADKARSVRRFCETHLERVIVAEENNTVAGFYSYSPHDEHGMLQLSANAVDPAFQGRGIGTAMARHVVRDLIENQDQENLFVATLAHDKPARSVYEKVGFSEVYRQLALSNWKDHLQTLKRSDFSVTGVQIRSATPADRDRLVHIACLDQAARFYPARLMEQRFGILAGRSWKTRRASEIDRQLDSDEVYVAEDGRGIAGYVSFAHPVDSEFGRLQYPVVDPDQTQAELRALLFDAALGAVLGCDWVRVVDITIDVDDEDALTSCTVTGFEKFSCGIGFAMKKGEARLS